MRSLDSFKERREDCRRSINGYTERKGNNMFDSFYHSHLNFFEECMDVCCDSTEMIFQGLEFGIPQEIKEFGKVARRCASELVGMDRIAIDGDIVNKVMDLQLILTTTSLKRNPKVFMDILKDMGLTEIEEILRGGFLQKHICGESSTSFVKRNVYTDILDIANLEALNRCKSRAERETLLDKLGMSVDVYREFEVLKKRINKKLINNRTMQKY